MVLASIKNVPGRHGVTRLGRGVTAAVGLVGVLMVSGCVNTGSGKMGLDFGEVLAKEQETFEVNGERAALRRYVNGAYDIKLYGPSKVMDLGLSKTNVSVANVAEIRGATLITLNAPEADCKNVYHVYLVEGDQSKKWQTSYRSCDAPLTFRVNRGQWTARQNFKPSVGAPYMLVYQNGNLYSRPIPVRRPAAPKPVVDNAANLDNVTAPVATGSNLDDIEVVSTQGLKAAQSTNVKMTTE